MPGLRPPAASQRRVEALYPALTSAPDASLDFSSVVLVAGGTGIAPMWQILQHIAAGAGTAGQLSTLPLTLLYSCRADDALLLDELDAQVAASPRALMRGFVTVTDAATADVQRAVDVDRYVALSIRRGRITPELIAEALDRHMEDTAGGEPCESSAGVGLGRPGPRVVLCGPAQFGIEMASLLSHVGGSRESMVTLQA